MPKAPVDSTTARPNREPTRTTPDTTTEARNGPLFSTFSASIWHPAHDRPDPHGQIHERYGIWVVTIGGIWRGDYLRREDVVAAVAAAPYAAP